MIIQFILIQIFNTRLQTTKDRVQTERRKIPGFTYTFQNHGFFTIFFRITLMCIHYIRWPNVVGDKLCNTSHVCRKIVVIYIVLCTAARRVYTIKVKRMKMISGISHTQVLFDVQNAHSVNIVMFGSPISRFAWFILRFTLPPWLVVGLSDIFTCNTYILPRTFLP